MSLILLTLVTLAACAVTGTVGIGGALLVVPFLTVMSDTLGLLPVEVRFTGYVMNFVSLEHNPISGNRLSDKLCDQTEG